MCQLEIFKNKLASKPDEIHQVPAYRTIEELLSGESDNYERHGVPDYSIAVDNVLIAPDQWPIRSISNAKKIRLVVEPKIQFLPAIIALVGAVYAYTQIPDIPDDQGSVPDGKSIYTFTGQNNSANPGGVLPQYFGDTPIYPARIVPVHRFFKNNEEWYETLAFVGKGNYEVLKTKLSETDASNYAGDLFYRFYEEGEPISGNPAHRHIYTAPEVGGSSKRGIELKYRQTDLSDDGWTYDTAGKTITSYFNDLPTAFPFAVGEEFKIAGEDNTFRVESISGDVSQTATLSKGVYYLYGGGIVGNRSDRGFDYRSEDESWTSFSTVTGGKLSLSSAQTSGDWYGSYRGTPNDKAARFYSFDVLFPAGLGTIENDKSISLKNVAMQVRYRQVGTEKWNIKNYNWKEATTDEIGFTVDIDAGQPINAEFEFRRTTREADELLVRDEMLLVRLKSELDTAASYPGTVVSISARGNNQISASSEQQFNIIARRKLNSVQDYINFQNGVALPEPQATQLPGAAAVFAAVKAGYPLTGINLEAWRDFDKKCSQAGQTYNDHISTVMALGTFHKLCARVGYGLPSVEGGRMSVRREEPTSSTGHLYTPFNTIGSVTQTDKWYDESDFDAVEVEYFPTESAKPATQICVWPPGAKYNRAQKIRLRGCNNAVQAYRYGMRIYQDLVYLPTQYRLKTEQDALNSELYGIAQITDALIGDKQGFVSGYDRPSNTLTLQQSVKFDQSIMFIIVSRADGQAGKFFLCSAGSNDREVILNDSLDFDPVFDYTQELPRFAFGGADTLTQKTRVQEVNPSGTERATLTAIEYYDEKFDFDNAYPPEAA